MTANFAAKLVDGTATKWSRLIAECEHLITGTALAGKCECIKHDVSYRYSNQDISEAVANLHLGGFSVRHNKLYDCIEIKWGPKWNNERNQTEGYTSLPESEL